MILDILGVPDPSEHRHSSSLPHHRPNAAIMPPNTTMNEQLVDYQAPGQHPNLIACFAAIVCIVALFMPTEGDSDEAANALKDYPYLHLTIS